MLALGGLDLGDVVLRILVKGRHWRARLHVSHPTSASAADRHNTAPVKPATGKVDHSMDLQADKKVTFSPDKFEDEMGNEVAVQLDQVTVTYSVDAPSIVALTDNGDGTAVAAATGSLGQAIVHVDVQGTNNGQPFNATGDELVTVVPGDIQRVTMKASAPEEVTPDQ